MALNIWKALYEPGDLVWILTDIGIFPGEIISVHTGPSGLRTHSRNGKGYLHYTGHYRISSPAWRFAKGRIPGSPSTGGLFARSTQFILREPWERTPLEKIRKLVAAADLLDKYAGGMQVAGGVEGLREGTAETPD